MRYEDQGIGVLFSHSVTARELLKQNKMPVNDENMFKAIQMLAEEKAESYTPSDELGNNPGPKVADQFREITAHTFYKNKGFQQRFPNKQAYKIARIEISAAVNHLTQVIMKHIFLFKTSRSKSADLRDPNQLTDFEYVQKGKLSPEELQGVNKFRVANRHLRLMIEGYVWGSLLPLTKETRESLYNMLGEMGYNETDFKTLKNNSNIKELAWLVAKNFGVLWSRTKFSDFFRGFKWTKKGPRLKPGKSG